MRYLGVIAMKKEIILIVTSLMTFTSCKAMQNDKISIIGDVEETIEVKTEYVEKGVTYPEKKYSLVISGDVDVNHLGRYEITYSLYTIEGEHYKDLHRFVNVVDTTKPTFIEAETSETYAGITYFFNHFVSDWGDNYDSKSNIKISQQVFLFTSPGSYDVSISFTDSSNNVSTFSKTINVILDPVKLLESVYINSPSVITTGTTGSGQEYTRVTIDTTSSFMYYHGSTMHYSKQASTSLATSASIQISAEYGHFNSASLTYHISGTGSAYSVGFATINALNSNVTVNSFSSTINNLGLDESAMLTELNTNLPSVLNSFHDYFQNTLHLELK